ncbi:lipoprotein-releasing system ATP-binding protein [Desulfurobacterium pacificum]|uniref:Lipoprotein-releasing system ATP-binding protein n=1 Tax=Desulfurobacterium pacificum TaxID=240166 RepID=A0ABY1NU44_9BACT|nr:ABC transporter ATP-binding protein [Desulfurobacterium pacificum]SMP18456.1 lipoprotein-releasing system ATP-binding protein [Desulfurobacterium pacificum]
MKEIVKVSNLWKIYQTETEKVEALKGISFSLEKGEFSVLMGASGSGKSTLLHILGTLDSPTKGEIIIDGVNPFSLPEKEIASFRNKKIGFIFQFHYLINELTVLENVMVPLLIAGVEKEKAEEKAKTLLKSVNLEHRLSHRPFEISGGEKQRVAVARALVNDPEIVLADEPTGNLDSETAKSVISLMRELNREFQITFFIATHNPELEKFADKTYLIKDGVLI